MFGAVPKRGFFRGGGRDTPIENYIRQSNLFYYNIFHYIIITKNNYYLGNIKLLLL